VEEMSRKLQQATDDRQASTDSVTRNMVQALVDGFLTQQQRSVHTGSVGREEERRDGENRAHVDPLSQLPGSATMLHTYLPAQMPVFDDQKCGFWRTSVHCSSSPGATKSVCTL